MSWLWGWARDAVGMKRPSWRGASVVGVAFALAVAAVTVDGFRSAKVDLDEASVWATNSDRQVAGRMNTQIGQVEVVSGVVSKSVDVVQRGREVAVINPGNSLVVIDPTSGDPAGTVDLTADTQVAAGGGRVALWSSKVGRLWLKDFDQLDNVDVTKRKGSKAVAADSVVAIGPTGAVFGASSQDRKIRHLGGAGIDGSAELELQVDGSALQVVVVDKTPVVLDTEAGKLQVGDRVVDLARYGASPQLQDGPARGSSVAVATDAQLVSVPLNGDTPTVIDDEGVGAAVRPVQVGRCVYGAWAGADGALPRESLKCGRSKLQSAEVDFPSGSTLRFRVNEANVILNHLNDGRSVVARDGTFVMVENWDDLNPKDATTEEEDPEQLTEGGDLDCSAEPENTAPEPQSDDRLGARPGVATVLNVLANDRDADCDVLAVTEVLDVEPAGVATILPIDRGHAVQFQSVADSSASVSFTYKVSDGRSDPVSATASVTIKPFDAPNEPPVQDRVAKMSAGPAQAVSSNVLESFSDPDGDPLVLLGASLPQGAVGTVRTQTDGTVTFIDAGSTASFPIEVQVSDGRAGAAGTLEVEMATDPDPIARNDHAVGLVDQPITIDVLANDTGVPGDTLSLASAAPAPADTSAVPDTTAGLVVFTAPRAGSYRVPYQIASGGKSAEAWIRVDVAEPTANQPPIAVRDIVSVVVGGSAMIDLVANDTDPNQDVLVVQSFELAPGSGITAELLEHRALRIRATRPEPQPVLITYSLTDGQSDPVQGQLVVLVTTTGQVNQPPTAKDDVAVVRVGDVVTVPVLTNDLDPDGDPLTVTSKVSLNQTDGVAAAGVAFTGQNSVRFVAGMEPGDVTINYEITDGISGTASALVRVRIAEVGPNQNPVPRSVDARTLAGVPITIAVPTFGIDPDGDAVTLAVATQGTRGTAELGEECSCFVYTPASGLVGTDTFTYTATDPSGGVGTATIRVGVGPRTGANNPPVAIADRVQVRPDGSFAVPVLVNDSDPDGDVVSLIDEAIEGANGVTAKVVGDRVQVQAADPTTATLTYLASDGKATTPGTLTVEVSADAPPVAPIARDDSAEVPKDRSASVTVPVLDNDEDPDGSMKDIELTVDASADDIAHLDRDERRIVVELSETARVVPYQIKDGDNLTAMAVVRVPSSNVNLPPRLKRDAGIDVAAGATVEVAVNDHVEDPEGKNVLLVPGDGVSGTKGTAAAVGPDRITFTADADYSGKGSINLLVTDGADPTDTTGARATLVIPVDITSDTNTQPTFSGASVEVEVSGKPSQVDLAAFVEDPDEGDLDNLVFSDVSGEAQGVTASLNDTTLKVTAGSSAVKNSKVTLGVKVTDGKGEPVAGSVEVSVVASRAPLAVANDDTAEASSGQPESIDVLANDQAPPDLDPLTLESAEVDAGLGTASVSGSNVVVTPSEEFVGVGTVTYTINDSLKDPDRKVTGKIQVKVKDRPAKLTAPPTMTDSGNRFAVLTWQAPNARGGTIDKYEITSVDGSIKKECTSTNCRLEAADGLKNATTYNFVVRAHNEVSDKNGGWSDPSERSMDVTPDERPNRSTVGPTLTYTNTLKSGELNIRWPAASTSGPWTNEGSDVVEYQVQLSPAPSNTNQLTVESSTTSFTITGLTDGVEYTARVRARNKAKQNDGWSEFSPDSNKESPASKPTSPMSVSATKRDDPVASVIQVKWSRPASINAKQLDSYTILVTKNGTTTRVAGSGDPSAAAFSQDVVADLGANYTFQVIATNKAGESPPSSSTSSITGFTRPARIASVTATATKANGQIQLSFGQPAANGDAIETYLITTSPGGTQFRTYEGSGVLMSGLNNGTPYTFAVSACNQGQNNRYCGEPVTSNSESPYGPPGAPGVSANHTGGNTVQLSWSAPAGNGRPIDRIEINVNGEGWRDAGSLNGSTDRNTGYSQTHRIYARAVSGGLTGPEATAATTTPRPPPTNQVGKAQGSANPPGAGTCAAYECSMIIAQLRDWAPGSTHSVTSTFGGSNWCTTWGPAMRTVTVDGNGNADVDTGCWAGNTNVGIIVDGNQYAWGWVNWKR